MFFFSSHCHSPPLQLLVNSANIIPSDTTYIIHWFYLVHNESDAFQFQMDETYIKSKKIQQLYTVKVLEYVNIKYVTHL